MPRSQKNAAPPDVPRIEALVEEVQLEHRVRLDILRMEDLVPRKFKRRPRPKTAIIAHAARVVTDVSAWIRNQSNSKVSTSETVDSE